MNSNPNDVNFQKFLDQKMNEIKNGVSQNIIRKNKENENKKLPTNPNDVEIVNSKFNKMIEDLRKSYPTLKQINTQYPNV